MIDKDKYNLDDIEIKPTDVESMREIESMILKDGRTIIFKGKKNVKITSRKGIDTLK